MLHCTILYDTYLHDTERHDTVRTVVFYTVRYDAAGSFRRRERSDQKQSQENVTPLRTQRGYLKEYGVISCFLIDGNEVKKEISECSFWEEVLIDPVRIVQYCTILTPSIQRTVHFSTVRTVL